MMNDDSYEVLIHNKNLFNSREWRKSGGAKTHETYL